MTAHTPGPWRLVHSTSNKMAVIGPKNDGNRTDSDRICNVPHRGGEGDANARLIAAAPEMVDLLRAIFISLGGPEAKPESWAGEIRAVLQKAGVL